MNKTFFSSIAALFLCTSAHGQATLSFSGGNGAPFTLTLAQSMNYIINTNHGPYQPTFLFAGVANSGFGVPVLMTGDMFFSVNGGTPQPVTLVSFDSGGMVLARNSTAIANFGDSVMLFAGTIRSTSNVFAAPPSSGQYVTYIPGAGAFNNQISTVGVPVPEPGSVALIGLAGAGICVATWKRCRRAQSPCSI